MDQTPKHIIQVESNLRKYLIQIIDTKTNHPLINPSIYP